MGERGKSIDEVPCERKGHSIWLELRRLPQILFTGVLSIMGLKRRTKRHHNNTPICFAHLDKCSGSHASWPSLFHMSGFSTNHLGLGLGLE